MAILFQVVFLVRCSLQPQTDAAKVSFVESDECYIITYQLLFFWGIGIIGTIQCLRFFGEERGDHTRIHTTHSHCFLVTDSPYPPNVGTRYLQFMYMKPKRNTWFFYIANQLDSNISLSDDFLHLIQLWGYESCLIKLTLVFSFRLAHALGFGRFISPRGDRSRALREASTVSDSREKFHFWIYRKPCLVRGFNMFPLLFFCLLLLLLLLLFNHNLGWLVKITSISLKFWDGLRCLKLQQDVSSIKCGGSYCHEFCQILAARNNMWD